MSKIKTNTKMTRDEVLAKLDEGVTLYSLTTTSLYKKVKGKLMRLTETSNGWEESDLLFLFPPSWEKMRVYDPVNETHLEKKKKTKKEK